MTDREMLPQDVRLALDRMCHPLDESVLTGETAKEDARCMKIIRDFIYSTAALSQQQEDYEELQRQYHFLASEMVYEGNSVQHWRQKALAYKECAGVIYELKSLLGVETPADVLEQVKTQQQEAEPAGWQFYQDGKWWHGDDRIKDHRKNTEEAGFPVRDLYATPQSYPDVSALVEALEAITRNELDAQRAQHIAAVALAAYRKGGE